MDPVAITVTCVSSIISAVVGGSIVLLAVQRPLKKFDAMAKKIEDFDETRIKKLEEAQKSCDSCETGKDVELLKMKIEQQDKVLAVLDSNRDAVTKLLVVVERIEKRVGDFELKLDSIAELQSSLNTEVKNNRSYIANVSKKVTRHCENHQ